MISPLSVFLEAVCEVVSVYPSLYLFVYLLVHLVIHHTVHWFVMLESKGEKTGNRSFGLIWQTTFFLSTKYLDDISYAYFNLIFSCVLCIFIGFVLVDPPVRQSVCLFQSAFLGVIIV